LTGEELCLRPDLTVPVSRLYLERHPRADVEARYCYNGPAFRFQQKGASQTHPREFRQAGIECFGVADRDNADAEVVLLVADAVRSAGLKQFRFRFGDIALFFALLDALSLPERWRLKLRHYFWRPPAFHTLLSRLAKGEAPDSDGPVAEFAATLAAQTPSRAEELVANYLETNDLPLSGNRTMSEITERLLDHAADLRAEPLPREVATVIDYYLAVEASPREAIDRIALIGQGAGIDLGPALYVLYRRFDLLEERGINVDAASFATEFGRDLEYYSGLVFQIEVTGDKTSPIAGGGRYDGLLRSVGARAEVPAVGSAIHTERLLAAVKGLS
jgi:ATP phosphoribosyltransferase regulatory subunit